MSQAKLSNAITNLFCNASAGYKGQLLQLVGKESELFLEVVERLNVAEQGKILSENFIIRDLINFARKRNGIANRLITLFKKLEQKDCVNILKGTLALQTFATMTSPKVQSRLLQFISKLDADHAFSIFAAEENAIKGWSESSIEHFVLSGLGDQIVEILDKFSEEQRVKISQLLRCKGDTALEIVESLKQRLEVPQRPSHSALA